MLLAGLLANAADSILRQGDASAVKPPKQLPGWPAAVLLPELAAGSGGGSGGGGATGGRAGTPLNITHLLARGGARGLAAGGGLGRAGQPSASH